MIGFKKLLQIYLKKNFFKDDDDEEGGEAYDLSKMSRENGEEDGDDQVKVHEIKFDEFGIMDDGLDDTTHQKLNSAEPEGTQIYF